jgi:glycosyltransferase involved in cell wall biosynthesis
MDLSYEVFKPGQINAKNGLYPKTLQYELHYTGPLVSCVMVTRGDLKLISRSARCFANQTWPNKELVVVTENAKRVEKTLSGILDSNMYRVISAPTGLVLGDYRNLSVAHSYGEYVCQWDDDDVYHPDRISAGMRTLMFTGSSAVFLSQWVMVWPDKELACLSENRIWEGSMIARRDCIPVYPSITRTEDTKMVDMLCHHHQIALLSYSKLYLYTVTGQNTNTGSHFEGLFERAAMDYEYGSFCDTVNKELGIDFRLGEGYE